MLKRCLIGSLIFVSVFCAYSEECSPRKESSSSCLVQSPLSPSYLFQTLSEAVVDVDTLTIKVKQLAFQNAMLLSSSELSNKQNEKLKRSLRRTTNVKNIYGGMVITLVMTNIVTVTLLFLRS